MHQSPGRGCDSKLCVRNSKVYDELPLDFCLHWALGLGCRQLDVAIGIRLMSGLRRASMGLQESWSWVSGFSNSWQDFPLLVGLPALNSSWCLGWIGVCASGFILWFKFLVIPGRGYTALLSPLDLDVWVYSRSRLGARVYSHLGTRVFEFIVISGLGCTSL